MGEAPTRFSKTQSTFGEVRLVDADDRDVPDGTPGELCLRGPTLFSGYWRDEEANEKNFRGGWFHIGDVFVRNPDGTLDFVDRVKYMIKSGGENVFRLAREHDSAGPYVDAVKLSSEVHVLEEQESPSMRAIWHAAEASVPYETPKK